MLSDFVLWCLCGESRLIHYLSPLPIWDVCCPMGTNHRCSVVNTHYIMIRKCGSLDFWMAFGKVPFPNILSILGFLLHFFGKQSCKLLAVVTLRTQKWGLLHCSCKLFISGLNASIKIQVGKTYRAVFLNLSNSPCWLGNSRELKYIYLKVVKIEKHDFCVCSQLFGHKEASV